MTIFREKVPYLLLLSYVTIALIFFPKGVVDDAFITFRYAENFANHAVLTWNVGEAPVEGYTGVVLPVTLGMLAKLGASPLISSQAIGVLSFVIGGLVFYALLGKMGILEGMQFRSWRIPIRGVLLLLYFTAPFLYTHAFAGLETVLFTTAVVACLYALITCVSSSEYQSRNDAVLLLLLLLTGLIRPEGVVLAFTCLIALGIIRIHYQRGPWKPFVARILLLFVFPGLIYVAWRWSYYGQILPNTYYAKSYPGGFNRESLNAAIDFFLTYIALSAAGALVLVVLEPDFIFKRLKDKTILPSRMQLAAYGAACAFVLLVFLQYLRSRLLMDYSFRFFVPFFPILLVGVGIAAQYGLTALNRSRMEKPIRFRLVQILLAGCLLVQIANFGIQLRSETRFVSDNQRLLADEHIAIGQLLEKRIPNSEWLVAYIDSGAIPFFSKLKTVDFGGLNDNFLSKGVSDKDAVEYFYSFHPGAVVFTSYSWDTVVADPRAKLIVSDPRFKEYQLYQKYRTREGSLYDDYYELVYIRKDLLSDFN